MEKQRNYICPTRLLGMTGFVALAAGTALNLVFGANFPGSLVPNTNVATPVVNGFCALMCLVFIFLPQKTGLLLFILVVQSVYDVLTGYELLGMFHFLLVNLVLFCKGFYKTKAGTKTLIIGIVWLLLLTTLFSFGVDRFVFALVVSLFMASAFAYIYYLLFNQLSFLLPERKEGKTPAKISLPTPGSFLSLSKLPLTDRQCRCIRLCEKEDLSYKQIGDKLYISESAIKKDMATIFDLFGVQNKEQFRILLSRYQLKE